MKNHTFILSNTQNSIGKQLALARDDRVVLRPSGQDSTPKTWHDQNFAKTCMNKSETTFKHPRPVIFFEMETIGKMNFLLSE